MKLNSQAVLPLLLVMFVVVGCNMSKKLARTNSAENTTTAKKEAEEPVKPNADGTLPSGTGVEKEKPASGKANVQGKAFFNDKPAVGVEVKLCAKFNQFGRGCDGQTFTAKTDENGEYLLKDVAPGTYEALTVRVFDTPFYVFATSGLISAAKYNIEADKTFFAPDSNLFKNDLKVTSPKASARVAPENIAVKWDAYPDAAYYKMSIHADTKSGAKANYDYINRRVDDPTFTLDKPLEPGNYTVRVDAFNGNDKKLAQSSRDMKFTVK